ncbi:MAG: protein kinase [Planctomycetota bacterium]|nr:protein kinase [Planctomycetota bacterium]
MTEEAIDRSGSDLGPYHLVRLLGRGGMGVVYEATDSRLGRTVALKILRPEVVGDSERRARFEREAKALAALQHPGIVTIHSFETIGEDAFFTMELVEGRTLDQVMRAEGAMSVARILEVGIPVADALAAAHKRGIAHRDIKPENIIIGPQGQVTVLDFGLAKLAGPVVEASANALGATASMDATVEGRIIGTIHYMAPEQAQGGDTTPTTDVFALGVVFYEMVTGINPFPGETTVSKLSSILKDDPQPIYEYNRQVPPELERMIRRCLEKDPDRRWQNALDVRNELELLRGELADPSGSPRRTQERAGIGGRIFIGMSVLALIAIVVGFAIGVLLMDIGQGLEAEQRAGARIGAPQCVSVMGPEGYEVKDAQISPDGTLLAMITRKVEVEGDDLSTTVPGERRFLHLRSIDSFETRLVADSQRILTGEFSPDGRSYTFVRLPVAENLRAKLMRIELGTGLPPVQVGAIPISLVLSSFQSLDSDIRGFTWLNRKALVFVTQAPYKVLTLDAKTGDEIARVDLDYDTDTEVQPSLLLAPIDEDHFLLGVTYYDERGYMQDVLWVDATTGEAGLVIESAPVAEVVLGNQLLFTKGATLYRSGYDPSTRSAVGPAVPVFTGLRTLNSWSSGSFDVARNGTLVHLPGGLQGLSRTLWTFDAEGGVPRRLDQPERAFEEWVTVSADGNQVLLTHTNDNNAMWDLWAGTIDPPRIRRIQSFPDRDIHSPVLSRDGSLAAGQITTTQPIRTSQLVVFDPGTSGRPLRRLDEREGGSWLMPYDIHPDNDRVVYGIRDEGGTIETLHEVGLGEGAAPRSLLGGGGMALHQHARWSPDGRLLAWTSNESGTSEALLARYGVDGLGRPVPVSEGLAQRIGWSVGDGGEYRLHYFANNVEFLREVRESDGAITLGPIVSTGRSLGPDAFHSDIDQQGGIVYIRRGVNEQPVTRVELISGFFGADADAPLD